MKGGARKRIRRGRNRHSPTVAYQFQVLAGKEEIVKKMLRRFRLSHQRLIKQLWVDPAEKCVNHATHAAGPPPRALGQRDLCLPRKKTK